MKLGAKRLELFQVWLPRRLRYRFPWKHLPALPLNSSNWKWRPEENPSAEILVAPTALPLMATRTRDRRSLKWSISADHFVFAGWRRGKGKEHRMDEQQYSGAPHLICSHISSKLPHGNNLPTSLVPHCLPHFVGRKGKDWPCSVSGTIPSAHWIPDTELIWMHWVSVPLSPRSWPFPLGFAPTEVSGPQWWTVFD